MSQLFRPGANTIARTTLGLGAVLPVLAIVGGSLVTRSPSNTKVTVPLNQPAPFSHKHHVKELGIDCRYCHSTVEDQANASVPSTEVCMSCHSQIWTNSPMLEPVRDSYATGKPIQWTKVNNVPDFVYFDHSIHVNRGISCNTCHGAVQEMPLTAKGASFSMSWCLDCHADPAKFLAEFGGDAEAEGEGHEGGAHANTLSPREQVFALYRKLAANEKLTETEWRTATGRTQQLPGDQHHEALKRMEERKINATQLKDCWVCHR